MTEPHDVERDPGMGDDLRLTLEHDFRPGARIKVVGVGGGGGNAVNRMVASGLDAVEFIVVNTDSEALAQSSAPVRLQIGAKLTKGLGAGADPNIGRQAALEDTEQLIGALDGSDMVFVTTGLGGGTGTGAAPVIANLASELGALTVAVVTKPFGFEGKRRATQAAQGLEELRECVDTVITIPNDRLLATIDRTTSLTDAFTRVDDVLHQAIKGVSDLILIPGLINLDFADVTTMMSGMGARHHRDGRWWRRQPGRRGSAPGDLKPAAGGRVRRGSPRSRDQCHRRLGSIHDRGERSDLHYSRRCPRGGEHHLWRRRRPVDGGPSEDHGDRDRLRGRGRDAQRPRGSRNAGESPVLRELAATGASRPGCGTNREASPGARAAWPGRGRTNVERVDGRLRVPEKPGRVARARTARVSLTALRGCQGVPSTLYRVQESGGRHPFFVRFRKRAKNTLPERLRHCHIFHGPQHCEVTPLAVDGIRARWKHHASSSGSSALPHAEPDQLEPGQESLFEMQPGVRELSFWCPVHVGYDLELHRLSPLCVNRRVPAPVSRIKSASGVPGKGRGASVTATPCARALYAVGRLTTPARVGSISLPVETRGTD